jgi:hypothetical protein
LQSWRQFIHQEQGGSDARQRLALILYIGSLEKRANDFHFSFSPFRHSSECLFFYAILDNNLDENGSNALVEPNSQIFNSPLLHHFQECLHSGKNPIVKAFFDDKDVKNLIHNCQGFDTFVKDL